MTRTFSDGHPKVLPACNFLSQYYFYNIFLLKVFSSNSYEVRGGENRKWRWIFAFDRCVSKWSFFILCFIILDIGCIRRTCGCSQRVQQKLFEGETTRHWEWKLTNWRPNQEFYKYICPVKITYISTSNNGRSESASMSPGSLSFVKLVRNYVPSKMCGGC